MQTTHDIVLINEYPFVVRQLRPSEQPLFRDHLLRLDKESRWDRFNGAINDAFLVSYAERCFHDGAVVIGVVEDGRVIGAAELHERPEELIPTAEIAFSVEHDWQNRGLGGLLFQRLLAAARGQGYQRLRVTTHSQNAAMKALARRYGAKLTFEAGETVGVIDLSAPAQMRVAQQGQELSATA